MENDFICPFPRQESGVAFRLPDGKNGIFSPGKVHSGADADILQVSLCFTVIFVEGECAVRAWIHMDRKNGRIVIGRSESLFILG